MEKITRIAQILNILSLIVLYSLSVGIYGTLTIGEFILSLCISSLVITVTGFLITIRCFDSFLSYLIMLSLVFFGLLYMRNDYDSWYLIAMGILYLLMILSYSLINTDNITVILIISLIIMFSVFVISFIDSNLVLIPNIYVSFVCWVYMTYYANKEEMEMLENTQENNNNNN